MNNGAMVRPISLTLAVALTSTAFAVHGPQPGRRFDALAFQDPAAFIDVAATPVGSLPAGDTVRAGWDGFRATYGRDWSIYLDRRSGAPLLAEGNGIPWPGTKGATVASLAASLRPFAAARRSLLLADDSELVLAPAASGELSDDVWQIVFDRAVAGIPVEGERYLFTIGHGHLVSFGAPRWSRIDASPVPDLTAAEAQERLAGYMNLTAADAVSVVEPPELMFVPLRASGPRYAGPVGSGYSSALVWRMAVRVEGVDGTWLARVDAHSGAIRSFADESRYVRVKGGVFPVSDDSICPSGCEQANDSMPFADVLIVNTGIPQTASTMGNFNCTPSGSIARTNLAGPYVKILDSCGAISQSLSCSGDLNLGTSTGTDCTVPTGGSAGNTHAARTSFHHVNRIAEHVRAWLPGVAWLTQQLTIHTNAAQGCVGGWDGVGINLGTFGNGCNNAGENAGVLYHEWGHGLDKNDGGDYDVPTEAYADVTSILELHASCVARGFLSGGSLCTGFGVGDACLVCTGAREDDWDQRAGHTPSTPAGYAATHCSDATDGGPCGKEQHCEGMIDGETLWDLAARDLPGSGLDQATAWSVIDRLWFASRLGSGGNSYNCSLPDSDGCSASSWFEKIRAIDDDDGNLANGTPHAAAIFAAFDRHKIACGLVSDASNQNSSSCPAFSAPTLTAVPGSTSASVQLTWTTAPGAVSYKVFRNDSGCETAMTRVAATSENALVDLGLANGIPVYYTVQASTANAACDGPVSACQAVTPQPFAGAISLDSGIYGCLSSVTVTVSDGNGAASLSAAVKSTTETTAETVALTKIAPGSTTYRGMILTTSNPPASDGLLSVTSGDTITATYVDANDGGGGTNIPRVATASVSCAPTGARPVADGSFGTAMKASRANPSGSSVNVTWDVATCSSTNHHLLYGDLAGVASVLVTGAACNLGTSGSASWSGVPAGNLWFVVVGDDNASTEGSWGTDGTGAQRGGAIVSGQCGMGARNNSGTCP